MLFGSHLKERTYRKLSVFENSELRREFEILRLKICTIPGRCVELTGDDELD
jgi:hypothetical protein